MFPIREGAQLYDRSVVGGSQATRAIVKDAGICSGEFGRTPSVELGQNGSVAGQGRDHKHWGFSLWMAGGGIKGGTIYGATDEFGFKAVENPVSAHDLDATILHLMGIDHV